MQGKRCARKRICKEKEVQGCVCARSKEKEGKQRKARKRICKEKYMQGSRIFIFFLAGRSNTKFPSTDTLDALLPYILSDHQVRSTVEEETVQPKDRLAQPKKRLAQPDDLGIEDWVVNM